MKNKKIVICLSIIVLILSIGTAYAADTDPIAAMSGITGDVETDVSNKLGPIINAVIGLIQIVGTGLSLIMVSILGIKYMIAAPNDKAEVKKQIAPMVIGCAILFASVNLIQIIANFTTTTFSSL